MDNHFVNYGSYFGEVTYGTASTPITYDRHLQTFQAGVNYVNYGKTKVMKWPENKYFQRKPNS
jgi:hypothetical protein